MKTEADFLAWLKRTRVRWKTRGQIRCTSGLCPLQVVMRRRYQYIAEAQRRGMSDTLVCDIIAAADHPLTRGGRGAVLRRRMLAVMKRA